MTSDYIWFCDNLITHSINIYLLFSLFAHNFIRFGIIILTELWQLTRAVILVDANGIFLNSWMRITNFRKSQTVMISFLKVNFTTVIVTIL